jgi:hypothetical protein
MKTLGQTPVNRRYSALFPQSARGYRRHSPVKAPSERRRLPTATAAEAERGMSGVRVGGGKSSMCDRYAP